jgi:dihydroorotase
MKILIRSANIINPGSSHHGSKKNILVENGIITEIGSVEADAGTIIEGNEIFVSAGWVDMNVFTGDPGSEHKEDISTVGKAAASGGFTEIACIPNTKPVIHSKDIVAYIKGQSLNQLVQVHPIAAVTLNNKGTELSEMIDLHHAGAVAFSDGDEPIWHSDVLLKALQYNQKFNGLVIQRPDDKYLSAFGQMNESKVSNLLGLKGIPGLAEEVVVLRDLRILEYTGGRLHFSQVSTPGSVNLIKDAKKKGLHVTCDVAAHHLILDESELTSFDTNFKVNPPLRSKKDSEFFRKAVRDSIIDCVVSVHRPQDTESKNLEFDHAEFGIVGLETVYPIVNTVIPELGPEKIVNLLSTAPRQILNLNSPKVEKGEKANLTIFEQKTEWTFSRKDIYSRSHNTPFTDRKFRGKVKAVINNNQYHINK